MNKIVALAALIVGSNVGIYGQLIENFSDGDFSANPAWSGDTSKWIVNPSFQLQSASGIANDTFYLSTPSLPSMPEQWGFWVNLTFNTSSLNFVDVYLVSNQENLKAANVSGYFVRIGGTADEICLYKRSGPLSGAVKIIDGADNATNKNNNIIRVQVTRSALGLWTLQRDTTGGTDYFTEGTATDNDFVNSTHFGLFVRQSTASFFNRHNFDDIYMGPIIVDTIPPVVTGLNVLDSNVLEIEFSEVLDQVSATTLTNYQVNNGIGSPSSIQYVSQKVVLMFSSGFQDAVQNTISINGVSDLALNVILPVNLNFTHFAPYVAYYRDIIINEMMPDPDPVVGLPNAEFVELHNISGVPIDMQGWTLSDPGTSGVISQSFVLLPDSFMILCPSSALTLLQPYGNVFPVTPWPALNNTSDSIRLRSPQGKLIDEVNYSDAWYRDAVKRNGGWALERINPTRTCSGQDNWTASVNPAGGTPNASNSVLDLSPDTIPPVLSTVITQSPTSLRLEFSEQMDSISLSGAAINISGGIAVLNRTIQSRYSFFMVLSLDIALQPGGAYNLSISGPVDCSGNPMPPSAYSFGSGVGPGTFDLVISELMVKPSPEVNLPNTEYIEIYNRSNKLIDLAGMRLFDETSSNGAVLPPINMSPGEYIIVCGTSGVSMFPSGVKVFGISSFPTLNDDRDVIWINDANGIQVHKVAYTDEWYGDLVKRQGGWSLEMIDTGNPCAGSANWTASVSPNGGTPSAQNSVKAQNPDLNAPFIQRCDANENGILYITFNETLSPISLSTSVVQLSGGINIAAQNMTDNKLIFAFNQNLSPQSIYEITIGNISDCVGNLMISSSCNFVKPEQAKRADMSINEVLFNPFTGGSDFVELFNRSGKYINLQNWQVANTSSDAIANFRVITTEPRVVKPGEFVVLTPSIDNILRFYPAFRTNTFISVNLPSYNNDRGTPILVNDQALVIDSFPYEERMHNRLLDDKKGVSLEKSDPDLPSEQRSSWHSASTLVNATPGYINSQYRKLGTDLGKAISIEPKVFTPDDDGINDFTMIGYTFDNPGYILNIKLFDANGRLLNSLVENQICGTEGYVKWDGAIDVGKKARVGTYLLFIEIFDTKGQVFRFKESIVVGAKFQ